MSPEGEPILLVVVQNNFAEVVNKRVVELWAQVVQPCKAISAGSTCNLFHRLSN